MVSIELKVDGIEDVLSEFKKLANYEQKLPELNRQLAEIGEREASYRMLGSRDDGNDDVTVGSRITDDGFEVYAEGDSVTFNEFGAGVTAGFGYVGDTGGLDISPGSYSKQHDGLFSKTNRFWFWNKKLYSGIYPTAGMYFAGVAIDDNVLDVAREVFTID